MTAPLPISLPMDRINEFCRRHRIARLSLFGSVIRDDFTPSSDVDVLVEFLPLVRIGYFGFQNIEDELGELLGRRVDLNTTKSLSPYFRQEVLRDARALYVAA